MNNLKNLLKAAAFAARQHTNQKRKGSAGEPYINHPLQVADLLINIGNVEDYDVLTSAMLHDTIEDTGATEEELAALFGSKVASIVKEVSDDKSLPKPERKRLQIEHAPHLSREAKLVKLADKISNITDITNSPPSWWNKQRRIDYVAWGEAVVAGLRGVNENLEAYFDEVVRRARDKFEDPDED